MKYLCGLRLWLLSLMVLLSAAGRVAAQAPAPGWAWAVSPGDGSAHQMVVDAAGNVYVTGKFHNTATFGATTLTSAGSDDVFVAKLTTSGAYQWAVRAGGRGYDGSSGLAVDSSGNVIITGLFAGDSATFGPTTLIKAQSNTQPSSYDAFVAKLSSAGVWQWATRAGGTQDDTGGSVVVDARGHILVSGNFSSPTITFGSTTLYNAYTGYYDMFIARLTPGGTWVWAIGVGGNEQDFSGQMAMNRRGDLYVTGVFHSSTITFGATMLTHANPRGADGFVAKLNAAGRWEWAVSVGGTATEYLSGVALDSSGNVVVVGSFMSPTLTFGATTLTSVGHLDIFVAKLTPAGAWLWATRAGGTVQDNGLGVAVDADNNILAVGTFMSNSAAFGTTMLTNATAGGGEFDVFVAKLSAGGAWQWAVRGGGTGDEVGRDVVPVGSNSALISGWYGHSAATFGATTLPAPLGAPGDAAFIARLSPITGLPEETPSSFTLAPNPATATVQLTNAPGPTATLLDGLGRVVRTVPLSAGAATLDVRGLASGLYVVRCGGAARRLVVE